MEGEGAKACRSEMLGGAGYMYEAAQNPPSHPSIHATGRTAVTFRHDSSKGMAIPRFGPCTVNGMPS